MDLKLSDVSKHFDTRHTRVEVLRGISFEMASGHSLAVTGPSGSGKSTLLHLIGTLDAPSAGKVEIDGQELFSLPEPKLAEFRNQSIGFVFQDPHLLPQYTVLENVLLPTMAFPRRAGPGRDEAAGLLEKVGLSHRLDHQPAELSGGERQRVALARALINEPGLLLCDEPTGNLDVGSGRRVLGVIQDFQRRNDTTVLLITHNTAIAPIGDRIIRLRDGQIDHIEINPEPQPAEVLTW